MINIMVPTPDECLLLLKRFEVPEHVIDHSRTVHAVALFLCRVLNRHGERLDQGRIEAGSLLHDIAKISALGTVEGHAEAGARLLLEAGFPEIAEIVRQHVVLDRRTNKGAIRETEVVHYADKRVKFTRVVSLAERFQDLKERYGKSSAALAWLEDLELSSSRLEKRLFKAIPILPAALDEISVDGEGRPRLRTQFE